MKIRVKEFKELIENNLNEIGKFKKGMAALATTATLLGSPDARGEEQKPPVHQQKEKEELAHDEILNIIKKASKKYNVPAKLIYAMIQTESSFKEDAKSSAGAIGLMQLMPQTAKWLGVDDPYDPEQNIMGGTKFIKYLLKKFNNDKKKAIAGYNAGPGAVIKHSGIPPYRETQKYVKKVLSRLERTPF